MYKMPNILLGVIKLVSKCEKKLIMEQLKGKKWKTSNGKTVKVNMECFAGNQNESPKYDTQNALENINMYTEHCCVS